MKTAVTQKHPFGCGVACVAFVLGLDYYSALKLFKNGESNAVYFGFYMKEIKDILTIEGLEVEYKYIKPKTHRKIYQNLSIVFIKRSKRYPFGHYLCRYNNLWMDPWYNHREGSDITRAIAGFRKKLPGKPIYVIFAK